MPSIFIPGDYGQLPAGARCAVSGRARGHRQPRLRITPEIVAAMGGLPASEGLKAGGMLPVIKHIPGHGRAGADTHFELPHVDAACGELSERDFAPFKALAGEAMAMTAHVVFTDIDAAIPATTSKTVIDDVIRSEIGFDGLLMSDDVSMNALSGDCATEGRCNFCRRMRCHATLQWRADGNGGRGLCHARAFGRQAAPCKRGHRGLQGEPDDSDEAALRMEFEGLMAAS
jgi:beta-N-acetylhexosaminidase